MPWPSYVMKAFEIAGGLVTRLRQHITYHTYIYLLIHLFPPEEGYLVHPQHPHSDGEGKLSYTVEPLY